MKAKLDLKGQRLKRLLVLKDTNKRAKNGQVIWMCRCDCGIIIEVPRGHLISGAAKSCGCLRRDKARVQGKNNIKHGDSGNGKSRLYGCWTAMKTRCLNSRRSKYHRYGGRGIQICFEWKNNYVAFKKWALVNGYKEGLTIDRIDNDGNYEPNNCQFITRAENARKANMPLESLLREER